MAPVTPRDVDGSGEGGELLAGTLKALGERLHRLELLMEDERRRPRQKADVDYGKRRKTTTCWNCGKNGHIARFCRDRGAEQTQGNSSPSVEMASHMRDNY